MGVATRRQVSGLKCMEPVAMSKNRSQWMLSLSNQHAQSIDPQHTWQFATRVRLDGYLSPEKRIRWFVMGMRIRTAG